MDSPSSPVTVNEMAVKVHKVALDAATGQIWLHTEAAVGMSDGSTRPGVVVTHFFNGKQGPEATTDDFGVATLQTHVAPDLISLGEPNTLTIRVRGSIKSASESFSLLTGSSASVYSTSECIKSRDYYAYSGDDYKWIVEVTVRLSKADFTSVSGVKVAGLLGGSRFSEGVTDNEGVCVLHHQRRFNIKTREGRGSNPDRTIDTSEGFPEPTTAKVQLIGFPDDYCIRVK